ncbi:sulfate transporter CysZ [Acidihalobacter ferrooxydans]|uniref:Sulfate transporter CysZ n=1 Tax=Acidihalobacter ferrooxydans TaxID=1765967 RepID=A0A1P8UHK1_9GAMM|nr:sulfate transporter CysZ [Acidihalobacter ferrooxydans]APZ43309.1 sulfate transporter CysZ [Acidihalobacter ferrooxydans]
MLSDFLIGFAYIFRGLKLIGQPDLRRYVVLPLLINTVLFAVALFGLAAFLDSLMQRYIPHWLSWLEWLLWPLLAIGFGVIVFYTFTLVANLIAASFTGLLAERIEQRLGGRPPSADASLWGNVHAGLIAMRTQLSALIYMLLWAIPLLLLSLIPWLAFLLTPLWLIFSSWMLALGYLAIPTGNHSFDFRRDRAIATEHRALMLGLGAGITLLTVIPILNFLVLAAGTAAATALWTERLAPSLPFGRESRNVSLDVDNGLR